MKRPLSMLLFLLVMTRGATANDVQPARALIEITGSKWKLTLTWDLAAQIVGVGAGHIPVEDAEKLVALSDAELQKKIDGARELLDQQIKLTFDGSPAPMGAMQMVPPAELRRAVKAIGVEGLVIGTAAGDVPGGAAEVVVRFPMELGPVILTITLSGAAIHQILSDAQPSWPVLLSGSSRHSWVKTAKQYIAAGFEHIIPLGPDHVLFVLGLFLLSARLKPLLWQVTAFTVAHSVTLALAMFGVVSVPSSVVEPLIALSIAYVAIENMATDHLTVWRPVVVFCFGLLHGLGFAGALREWGLPRDQFVTALIGFNVGVELGQLTVIVIAFALVGWFRGRPWYRRWIVVPAWCAIAVVALYWAVVRVVG